MAPHRKDPRGRAALPFAHAVRDGSSAWLSTRPCAAESPPRPGSPNGATGSTARPRPRSPHLHAKPRHTDVARLDRAFAAEPTLTSVRGQAGAVTKGGPTAERNTCALEPRHGPGDEHESQGV